MFLGVKGKNWREYTQEEQGSKLEPSCYEVTLLITAQQQQKFFFSNLYIL